MNQKMHVAAWLFGIAVAGAAWAQEEAASDYPNITAGGDFRLREEIFDHLPFRVDPPGETRGGHNDYIRFRTRLWSQVDLNENVSVYGRLCNEFRHYYDPESTTVWDYPDEVVVDNLYVDIHKLLADESLSFRIGRQDLFFGPGRPFGNGRLILEGTPKDGSRTLFFDAVRSTWKKGDTQIDAIGIYNQSDAHLLINDQDRDLTGYSSAYNDLHDYGGMLHGAFKVMPDLAVETYYIFKRESRWENDATPMPGAKVHTLGGRLAPKFNDRLSGSLEAAYQLGERDNDQDIRGYMVDAFVKADFMAESATKPWVSAGLLYFSGNDPDSSDDEGWQPLWARYPQFGLSDLLVYTYDAEGGGWSNLGAPYLSAGLTVHKDGKLSVMASPLMAPEENGPGSGDQRGLYVGAAYNVVLARGVISSKDDVKGHLQAELLDPGNYYRSGLDTGYFIRWELMYTF